MKRTNKSRYALLGMLSSGPKTGYEIKAIFERSLQHFWSESYGQIYPTLAKLTKEGLVSFETKKTVNSGVKKVYTIT
jgi:DNA-binding PadR family transcriptional regulator